MTKQYTSIHAEAGLHRKLVLFAVQLEGYLAHFPNCHKYTLTQGIRAAFLDVYNLVTEAQKRYQKKTALTQLDIRHEQLRMQVHLANELGLFGYSGGKRDASARFVRPHVISAMRTAARRGRLAGVVSRLGHARRTASLHPLLTHLKERHAHIYRQLPKSFHAAHRHSSPPA